MNRKWWEENVKKGDKISFKSKENKEISLIFERVAYYDQYGEDLTQLIFQRKKEGIGDKANAIIYHPEDIQMITNMNDTPMKIFKSRTVKINYNMRQSSLDVKRKTTKAATSVNGQKKSPVSKEQSVQSGSGFNVQEINGRFVCPCGNSYFDRGHAVWNHKNHIRKGMKK